MSNKISKPKTQRGKRFLLNRESKFEENKKSVMLVRGGKTSETVTQAMRDIHTLKRPDSTMFSRKNILRPFEDQTSLEFFSQKADSSLLLFGSHSKKRPNNLVFGSFFDYHILDMFELGIDKFIPISNFKAAKVTVSTKPCLLFAGEEFESKSEYMRLKTFLTDFWRGEKIDKVRLQGLEHVIQVTACDGKIYFRSYRTSLKKSGLKTPRVEVEEIGPSFDFTLRRTHLAAESLYKDALRRPKLNKPKKKKNVAHDVFGTKTGLVHMEKQDLGGLQTRKMKGLKKNTEKKDKSLTGENKRKRNIVKEPKSSNSDVKRAKK
jgi:ribosome production factor 2